MIVVDKLTKFYGKVKALDDVTFSVSEGQSVIVFGPSGSGKTTLLRLIAGLETPDTGVISIAGRLASRPGWVLAPHKREIGFVFQEPALWPHMTVRQNILFGLNGFRREEAQKRLDELLDRIQCKGLGDRYPDEISGGEARRVSVARSLAPRPKYLLMDEPLIHLDTEVKARMLSLIQESASRTKATLVYVTHDAKEAEQVSGRVIEIVDGRLNLEGGGISGL